MKISNVNLWIKLAFALLAIYLITYYGLIFMLPEDKIGVASDIVSPIGYLLGIIIMWYSVKSINDKFKTIWILFFIGNTLFLLGDIFWMYYEIIKGVEAPYPCIADYMYIASPVCYFIALLLYLRYSSFYLTIRTVFDILITMVVATALDFNFILIPIYKDMSLTIQEKIFSMIYPITDLGLLVASLLLLFNYRTKIRNTHIKVILITMIFWVAVDQVYSIKSLLGLYNSGDVLDPLWPTGTILLSIASLFAVRDDNIVPEVNNEKKINLNKLTIMILPYVCVLGLIIVLNIDFSDFNPIKLGAISSIFLIIIRQVFTLLENQRLMISLTKSKAEIEKTNKQLEKINLHVQELARTDHLTQLFNRRYMDNIFETYVREAVDNKSTFSFFILDIDHFKKVNDTYGHEAGDLVLKEVAGTMKSTIRSCDCIGRWGGEEFIAILPNTALEGAEIVAERLRHAVEKQEVYDNSKIIKVTVSIGVTQYIAGLDDIDSIIERADKCLYEAKNTGRDKVVSK